MRNRNLKNQNKMSNVKNGFSIAETMIAVSVLVVGLISLLLLVTSSIRHSMDARDQIIATGLAQEGVEIIRNFRDTDVANGRGFGDAGSFLDGTDKPSCNIGPGSPSLINCDTTNSKKLYIPSNNPNNNFYTIGISGTPTKFQRKIQLNYGTDADGDGKKDSLTVKSMVIWGRADDDFPEEANCNTANKCILVQDILVNR